MRTLPLHTLATSTPLFRITGSHSPAPHDPTRFSGDLFAHHIRYYGLTPLAAFTETCIRPYAPASGIHTYVASAAFIDAAAQQEATTTAPLVLVDLTAEALISIGATHAISTTADYSLTQRWASALHDHPAAPAGLLYRSNLSGHLCAALFKRCHLHVHITATHHLSHHDPAVIAFLAQLNVALM